MLQTDLIDFCVIILLLQKVVLALSLGYNYLRLLEVDQFSCYSIDFDPLIG